MRPLRPLAALMILATLWLWWRAPVIRRDIARLSAAAQRAGAELARAGPVSAPVPRVPAPLAEARIAIVTAPMPAAPNRLAIASPARRLALTTGKAAPPAQSAVVASPPPLPVASSPPPMTVASAAEAGYRALAAHDRRTAAEAFRRALIEAPGDPRATAWRRQLAAIERRWSGSAYLLVRQSGASDLAVAPVLGGGQGGAQLAYSLNPLARRPVEIEARATAPTGAPGRGGQAALGLAWHVLPGASVTVERLFALGSQARGGWTGRASGGVATAPAGAAQWLDASLYGEAGAVGLRDVATYAAAQGRIGRGVRLTDRLSASAGLGGWASVQHERTTVDRVDVGPTAALRMGGLEVRADYRVRIAGNARPGSGPALTIAGFF